VLTNDPLYTIDLALAGVGIAYVFEPLVRGEIRERRLRWLMPEASTEWPGLFLYYPRRASEVPKLRAFIDAASQIFKITSNRAREPE
jgi:DNA-binding transcriptional LysR family regulator